MERESNSASVETLCRALCKEGKKAIAAKVFNLDDEVIDRFDANPLGWSDWLERNCTVL